MSTPKRALAALVVLTTLLLAGCSGKSNPAPAPTPGTGTSTGQQAPAKDGDQAKLEQEQKAPLTDKPSTPYQLSWTAAAPSVSQADLTNTVVKAYPLINSGKAADAVNLLKPYEGARNADVQIALGVAYFASKHPDEAAAAYVRAIDVDPQNPTAHNNLANVYRDEKKYDLAVAEYQKALEADPKDETAVINLQALLVSLNRPAWAEHVVRNAVAANPKSATLQVQLGQLLAMQKRYTEASAAFEAALKIDPNNVGAKTALSTLPSK